MNYPSLLFIWCMASLVGLGIILLTKEYSPIYMVHFFLGVGVILIYGFFEAGRKENVNREEK